MTRADPRPEIELFGAVRIRKRNGPGWVVGEVYPHASRGTQAVRPMYVAEAPEALLLGTERALDVLQGTHLEDEARAILAPFATDYVGSLYRGLDRFPIMLPFLRGTLNMSRSELAGEVGTTYETIRRIEKRLRGASTAMTLDILKALGADQR